MKDPRRFLLLVIAVVGLTTSLTAIAMGNDHQIWSVVLRASILLGVVWMALPEISKLSLARNWQVLAGAAVLAITIVTRPKLVPFVIAGTLVVLIVNFVLRTIVRATVDRNRRE